MYFPHEERFIQELGRLLQDGEKQFIIQGASGCGKTYTLESFLKKYDDKDTKVLYLSGDKELVDREYKPFLDGLSNNSFPVEKQAVQSTVTEIGGSLPAIGKHLKILLNFIFEQKNEQKKNRDAILTEIEQDIICKIEALSKKHSLIFMCDNVHYWDERSLKLMYIILKHLQDKYKFLHNAIFLFLVTTDQEHSYRSLIDAIVNRKENTKLFFSEMGYEDFEITLKMLNFSGNLTISDKKMLHSLIKGHLLMLKELVREINNKSLDLSKEDIVIKEVLLQLLENRLKEFGIESNKVNLVLEYASILGVTFSEFELNRITELEKSEFNRIIDNAKKIELVHNSQLGQLKFAHELIRDIFKMKILSQEIDYYRKIEQCISEISPDHYLRRAKYLFNSEDTDEALILFVLEVIKQMRESGDITPALWRQARMFLKDHPHYWSYIEKMKTAMNKYNQNKYDEAYIEVSSISEALPNQLIAEKQILSSLALAKRIDADYRNKAIYQLERYYTLEQCENERDIYERIQLRLMILYIHVNEIQKARQIEESIIHSIRKRIGHDDTANNRLHMINRISSALYDCEIACKKIENSVDFFGPNSRNNDLWTNLKQYFISLINYSASLCTVGRFQDSFLAVQKAMKLMEENPSFDFPRKQILMNNYLVSGYLSNQFGPNECINGFKEIIANIPLCAERLFYTSNLSIFMAISGDVKGALDTLELESNLQDSHEDPEKIYNYRVVVNCAVYHYLLGNVEKAIAQLSKLEQYKKTSIDGSLMVRRKNELLLKMKSDNSIPSYLDWENILLKDGNEKQTNPWLYYGKGYVFSSLSNWDLW